MAIAINGTGTITGITAGGLPDGIITRAEIGFAGAMLQIVQSQFKGIETIASGSYVATSVSASITPTSATSKILVTVVVHVGVTGGNEGLHGRLYRNGSNIADAIGDASGSRDQAWFHCGAHAGGDDCYAATAMYLDSPASTSSQTYTVYARGHSSIYPIKINTSENDVNESPRSRTVSSITLMEVAA